MGRGKLASTAKNRRELELDERGAIHLCNRAAKYLVKMYYTPMGKRYDGLLLGAWEAESAEDAKRIIDSCSAAIFHGGDPKQAQKKHWSQEIA